MTAVFAGMLALGGAFWLSELSMLVELPTAAWSMGLGNMTGDLASGTTVTLVDASVPPVEVATGVVRSVSSHVGTSGTAIIGQIQQVAGHFVSEAKQVSWPGGAGASPLVASITGRTPIPIFNLNYIRYGVGGLAILAGAYLVYWLVARNLKSVDFLVAVDGEMKKVNWSTKRIVQNSTTVVIGASFFIAGALFVIDYAFSTFFQLVGVMPK